MVAVLVLVTVLVVWAALAFVVAGGRMVLTVVVIPEFWPSSDCILCLKRNPGLAVLVIGV